MSLDENVRAKEGGKETTGIFGGMAEWQNGRMAERQNGRMAEWRNGMAEYTEYSKIWNILKHRIYRIF